MKLLNLIDSVQIHKRGEVRNHLSNSNSHTLVVAFFGASQLHKFLIFLFRFS